MVAYMHHTARLCYREPCFIIHIMFLILELCKEYTAIFSAYISQLRITFHPIILLIPFEERKLKRKWGNFDLNANKRRITWSWGRGVMERRGYWGGVFVHCLTSWGAQVFVYWFECRKFHLVVEQYYICCQVCGSKENGFGWILWASPSAQTLVLLKPMTCLISRLCSIENAVQWGRRSVPL